jgi:hypothetical protein
VTGKRPVDDGCDLAGLEEFVQRLDRSFIYSPADLNNFLECKHLTSLEVALARGTLTGSDGANAQA